MKKVLLIPTYYYLSNPSYISMKEILDEEFEFVYFFSKDSVSISSNLENISLDKVGKYFDDYIELEFNPIWVKMIKEKKISGEKEEKEEIKRIPNKSRGRITRCYRKIKRIVNLSLSHLVKFKNKALRTPLQINNIYKYYNIYVKEFCNEIEKIKPDYIVITSDLTISYRIIKKHFPEIKLIILQPCFLDFRNRELKKFDSKRKVLNFFLKGIFLPNQPYFGLENKSTDKLLLFEDKFFEFYKNKRENICKIVNPFFVKLNEQIKSLDIVKIKNKLSHIINIDLKREIVIVYVSDYTSFHGSDIHNYTVESYIKLIKKFADKYTFIIKNHPRAGVKDFEKNFIGYEQVFFLNNEIEYNELLSIGNLNISINSNASLESIVCGMPTINFLPLHLKENDHFKWLSYYGGVEANTYEDLELLLKRYLEDKNFYVNKLNEGRKKLVGTREDCKRSLLDAFESV